MPDDLQEVIDQGKDELSRARAARLADITEGEIEVDPDLLDVGDEVADDEACKRLHRHENAQR